MARNPLTPLERGRVLSINFRVNFSTGAMVSGSPLLNANKIAVVADLLAQQLNALSTFHTTYKDVEIEVLKGEDAGQTYIFGLASQCAICLQPLEPQRQWAKKLSQSDIDVYACKRCMKQIQVEVNDTDKELDNELT